MIEEKVDETGRSIVSIGGPPVEREEADEATPDELVNVVDRLTKDEQKKLASQVISRFESDAESRAPYMRRCRKWKRMYHLVRDPKSFPFHGCANIGSPLLATVVLQIHARLFDMVWPADGMIFQSKPSTADEQEIDRAWRTEVFGNHYLRADMPDYEVGLDDSLWQMVIFGSAFRFRAWDPAEGRIVVKWIPVDDLVVQYAERCTDPSMRGVPRYSWLRRMTLNEMDQYEAAGGYFANVATVRKLGKGSSEPHRSEMKKATDDIAGVKPPSDDSDPESAQRRVIEQYCWLKFPKSKKRSEDSVAFDGQMHPFVVDVDEETRTVLRVALREEDDPKDAKRYQREMEEYQTSLAMVEQMALGLARREELRARDVLELDEADELSVLEAMPTEMPELEAPRPQRRRELCYIGHLRAFPNEGFYGTGFGDLVGPLNEATDLILNAVSDAMTLQNAGGGFISQSLTGPKGDVSVRPGAYVRVNGSPQSIRDGIQHHKFPGPSPVAMPMADTLMSLGHQLSGSGSILSGEKAGSHETATTSKIRLEQAIKQISVLSRRVVGYMKHEIAAIWRLFSVFIDEDDAVAVVNAEGSPVTIRISREDFIPDANVTPAANPLVSSRQQRIEEAQERSAMLLQHPATQQMVPLQIKAITDVLRAQGAHEYVAMINQMMEQQAQAQQQAQAGPPPMSQVDENMAMLQGSHVPVHPEDDDEEHLNEIGAFTETPAFEAAPPPVKMMLAQHRLEHLGQGYVKSRRANVRPNMVGPGGNGEVQGGPPGS